MAIDSEAVKRLRESPGARYFAASLAALAIDYVVTLALYHGSEPVGSGAVPFAFFGCGEGEYKSLDGDAVVCATCPADTFCVNNAKSRRRTKPQFARRWYRKLAPPALVP